MITSRSTQPAERTLGFVDTNVLVYAFDKSYSSKKQVAQRLMNELMEEDRLRVSTQVLQELFVTLTRKVSQPCSSKEALAVLQDLTAWPLMVVDYAAIRAAVGLADQAKLSFWDALVVIAARTGAAVLYTEDLNDQEILGVRIAIRHLHPDRRRVGPRGCQYRHQCPLIAAYRGCRPLLKLTRIAAAPQRVLIGVQLGVCRSFEDGAILPD
jgi:predicted nucleic acid-binding protein